MLGILKDRVCWKFQPTKGLSVCSSPLRYLYNGKTTIISMILVIEAWNLVLHAKFISGIKIYLNLTIHKLLALPHSRLPTSRHETAVSIIRLQIWNQHHLLPFFLSASNLDRNLGVFIDIFGCTTYYGQAKLQIENRCWPI